MNLVWDLDVPPADKILLLKMADVADDDGELQYKDKDKGRLAARCSMSERTIARLRRKYIDDGIIQVVEPGGGRGKTSLDRLNLRLIQERVSNCRSLGKGDTEGLNPDKSDTNPTPGVSVSESPQHPPIRNKQNNKKQEARLLIEVINGMACQLGGDTFSLATAWWAFVAHRAEIKKPLTERAAKMTIKELAPFSEAEKVALLARAVQRRWTGVVFENDKPGKVIPSSTQPDKFRDPDIDRRVRW